MNIEIIANRFVVQQPMKPRVGGTARVYKALDCMTGEPVALKQFEGTNLANELLTEFFAREMEALTALKHPNIVELKAGGVDPTTGRYYIVLEWMESNLSEYLKDHLLEGWDSFAETVVLPILRALAMAHSRGVLHRDIKPSNILLSKDGVPKLADFGLAKVIHSLRMGMTVNDFASQPYAPPEHRTEPASYRGDLFSLGITILTCLVPEGFVITHETLDEAIYEADLPLEISDFVRRLVSLDPSQRPLNAQVALLDLERIQRARPKEEAERPKIHLMIPPGSVKGFCEKLGCSGRNELEQFVLKDLTADVALSERESTDRYNLLGQEVNYVVTVGRDRQDVLVLVDAFPFRTRPSLLEHLRENAMPLSAEFTFSKPFAVEVARAEILRIRQQLAEFSQEQRARAVAAEERRLFRQWESILRAKTDLERSREKPLPYTWFSVEGSTVRFLLTQEPDDDIVGQVRCVQMGRDTVSGTVEDVNGNEVVLYVHKGDPARLPQRGSLTLDNTASQIAIDRQFRALSEARYGRGARPDISTLLAHPDQAKLPETVTDLELMQPLDEPKKRALSMALGAPDIAAIEGPPGTGKTRLIAELVCQFLKRNPGKKVLLSGQTHIAVDNALARIRKLRPDLRVVRVGPREKVATEVEGCRVFEQLHAWREEVSVRSEQFIRDWAAARGITDDRLSLADDFEALVAAEEKLEGLREKANALREELSELERQSQKMDQLAEEVFSKAEQVSTLIRGLEAQTGPTALTEAAKLHIEVSLELIEALTSAIPALKSVDLRRELDLLGPEVEAARAEVQDLRARIANVVNDPDLQRKGINNIRKAVDAVLSAVAEEASQIGKLKGLQRDWLQRFGHGPEFEAALLSIADVVAGTCVGIAAAGLGVDIEFDLVIIDEASKATPTEALVAMTRGKRWVLVGDHRQLPPFVDQALWKEGFLDQYDLTRQDVEQTLFDRLLALLPKECKESLTVQHRMLPAIGDLISQCFYDGKLESARQDEGNPIVREVLKRPVTWFSTSRLQRRREVESRSAREATSYQNLEEASRIRRWLEDLETRAQAQSQQIHVAVITGYSAQKEHLTRELVPTDKGRWQALTIEINSVDAFQGRESDVVVYSVTRSNDRGDLGFLTSAPRLNVALSRGRDALVIFGDSVHCTSSREIDNPFRKVVEYIEAHSESCALEWLE